MVHPKMHSSSSPRGPVPPWTKGLARQGGAVQLMTAGVHKTPEKCGVSGTSLLPKELFFSLGRWGKEGRISIEISINVLWNKMQNSHDFLNIKCEIST